MALGWVVFLATFVAVLSGCVSTFPQFQPDRCHRGDPSRDTLYWDVFCRQSP